MTELAGSGPEEKSRRLSEGGEDEGHLGSI